jgi:hypothetical protein
VTGDDHNTDALIAALRSPALPAEQAGEAAAVAAMLGAVARNPASKRFRASRGIAIAVVTVASLGVGGLAAAGPGVFHAAAGKARSFVTPDSTDDSENADGAATGNDPHSDSLPNLIDDPSSIVGVAASAATLEPTTTGDCSSVPCGVGANAAGVVPTTPPPECADGTHGDAVGQVAKDSVPPTAEDDHGTNVSGAAHAACTPDPTQQGRSPATTNPNKPTDVAGGPPSSLPAHEPNGPPASGPPVTIPPRPQTGPPVSTPGQGNGAGGNQSGGNGQPHPTPPASVPPDNGNSGGNGNRQGDGNGG